MKRMISMMLVLMMVLSMSAVVFAADGDPDYQNTFKDDATVTIKTNYKLTNEGTTSPAETFEYTIEATGVTDAAEGVTVETMKNNMPTIDSVTYNPGAAGNADEMTQKITVTLPVYTSVGIYTYTIKETDNKTAGVTYFGEGNSETKANSILLRVTVVQNPSFTAPGEDGQHNDGRYRVAAVHTEKGHDGTKADGKKSDVIENEYSASSLAVSKKVTGNLGDREKEFKVTVKFTAPDGETVKSDITYEEDGDTKTISAGEGWTEKEVVINLKHEEIITFTNIPYGVTYTVVEDGSYQANEGYDAPEYVFSDTETKINTTETDTVTITNNKGKNDIDTGVLLDSLPYILVLGIAVVGTVVFFVMKKRTAAADEE